MSRPKPASTTLRRSDCPKRAHPIEKGQPSAAEAWVVVNAVSGSVGCRVRFLHCSDLHLRYLQGTQLRELCNKRITGALNLVLSRSRAHSASLWESMLQKAQALAVDEIWVSGDLINLGMDREFEACARELQASAMNYRIVPGNHDIYLSQGDPQAAFERHFSSCFGKTLGEKGSFPYLADLGELALYGLNSSIGRPWFMADGRLGEAQLSLFEDSLRQSRALGKACVVMLHHPVTDQASRARRDLADRAELARILARHGADLVLHGHEHRHYRGKLDGPQGTKISVHGVASATSTLNEVERRAAFTLYEIIDGRLRYQSYCCTNQSLGVWELVDPSRDWTWVGAESTRP